MAYHSLNYGSNDIWQLCQAYHISPNAMGQITGYAAYDYYFVLYDEAPGAMRPPQTFVLFHPTLANKFISGSLTVLKAREAASGFSLRDARQYRCVFVVGGFTDAELAPLLNDGGQVETVPYDTPRAVRDYLESHL